MEGDSKLTFEGLAVSYAVNGYDGHARHTAEKFDLKKSSRVLDFRRTTAPKWLGLPGDRCSNSRVSSGKGRRAHTR